MSCATNTKSVHRTRVPASYDQALSGSESTLALDVSTYKNFRIDLTVPSSDTYGLTVTFTGGKAGRRGTVILKADQDFGTLNLTFQTSSASMQLAGEVFNDDVTSICTRALTASDMVRTRKNTSSIDAALEGTVYTYIIRYYIDGSAVNPTTYYISL